MKHDACLCGVRGEDVRLYHLQASGYCQPLEKWRVA